MTSRISHTTIDSGNAYQQSVWWAQVLSMREDPQDPNEPGHEECMIFSVDGRTRLLFVDVPEGGWVTLADPEGNEFCVLRSDRQVSDT